ncbi:MAG: SUMF1/EgtB/PvdO family nonheme iron enzyme [Chroococcales cyanobacterium]
MKFLSIQSQRKAIRDALEQCRQRTLELFVNIEPDEFSSQAHPEFSPVGWHLGHIAFTEAYWILERYAGLPPRHPQYELLFRADGLPKEQRQNLPNFDIILDYLETIRTEVFSYLETAPLEKEERLWRWLIQHESQHNETIAFLLQLQRWKCHSDVFSMNFPYVNIETLPSAEMVDIPAGEFEIGSNAIDSQDNERPAYHFFLDSYQIDRYPVTCGQYREFIEAGGYQNPQWWSESGWKWLEKNPVNQPLYWSNSQDWDTHPVCGVSWYEAQAYANFVGKRLPTQAEWEKAASWDATIGQKRIYPWGNTFPSSKNCNHNTLVGHTTPVNAYGSGQSPYGCYDMLGNVWEWTASYFEGYVGFKPYPYQGYSQVYFDQQHYVLMGGSWATRPWGLRSSFRNWYHPHVRQILAGFRCARSE